MALILDWKEAAQALLETQAVGILPSDTLYGLMCRAADEKAAERLYALKHRENKPGTLIAASVEQLVELGIKARYMRPVEHYWPGSISIIIPTGNSLGYLTQETGSIAVRVIAESPLKELMRRVGPLLTSSANQSGMLPAENIEQAKLYFNDNVDFYVDGGTLAGRQPSTIIRIIDDAIEILRDGAVKINEKGEIL